MTTQAKKTQTPEELPIQATPQAKVVQSKAPLPVFMGRTFAERKALAAGKPIATGN